MDFSIFLSPKINNTATNRLNQSCPWGKINVHQFSLKSCIKYGRKWTRGMWSLITEKRSGRNCSFQPFLICIPSQDFLQGNKWSSALLTETVFFLCYLSCKPQRSSRQTPRGQCTNHMQKVHGTWKPKSGTDYKQKWKHHPGLGNTSIKLFWL